MYTAHPSTTTQLIAAAWQQHHYGELCKKQLTHADIAPVIKLLSEKEHIEMTQIGSSCCQRSIHRLTLGHGPIVILAWSQMHGDESTATASVLDWLTILLSTELPSLPLDWRALVTIHVIPMLNPDGAQRGIRVNQQGIDINRDARQLQTPEGALLWQQVQRLKPDVAFNLHDQNSYYSAGNTQHPSTIAFLAPAFHPEKHVDSSRLRAKQLIAFMADALQHWLPQQIARYDDTYSHRSFGDNIAATGASTILIESGAATEDPCRQVARKMNVVALQIALDAIISQQYTQKSLADYYRIPENIEDGLTDIKFLSLKQQCHNHSYHADISLNYNKLGQAQIKQVGDLSTQSAFSTFDSAGAQILPMKGYDVTQPMCLTHERYSQLLDEGFCYFVGESALIDNQSSLPVYCSKNPLEYGQLQPGAPGFWLMQNSKKRLAVLNGKVIQIEA